MNFQFSKHASQRLSGRMLGIVTVAEVANAIASVGSFGLGETAVVIKKLPHEVKIYDPADGSVSKGSLVIAVYRRSSLSDRGVVATIELRGSSQSIPARWSYVVDNTHSLCLA